MCPELDGRTLYIVHCFNEFDLHENEPIGGIQIHMKGFASDSGMAYYMGVFALHVFVSKPGRNLQNS